jgi:toxin FitB
MSYLVDANVLCESSKTHPEPAVQQWLAEHDAELHVSVLTLGEMLKGIHLMDQGNRRHDIERWYQRIERWAANRLLVMDAPVMNTWGRFYAKHQRTGLKLPLMDSLLAATALRHQLTIVTRNTTDFPDDVPLVNPWTV